MLCPKCKETDRTRVIETAKVNGRVRRRRECPACDERFTTYEQWAAIEQNLEKYRSQLLAVKRIVNM